MAEKWEAPPSIAAKEKCPHARRGRPSVTDWRAKYRWGRKQRLVISHTRQASGEPSDADLTPHPLIGTIACATCGMSGHSLAVWPSVPIAER